MSTYGNEATSFNERSTAVFQVQTPLQTGFRRSRGRLSCSSASSMAKASILSAISWITDTLAVPIMPGTVLPAAIRQHQIIFQRDVVLLNPQIGRVREKQGFGFFNRQLRITQPALILFARSFIQTTRKRIESACNQHVKQIFHSRKR